MSESVLRERLEMLAERGEHRGADAVVAAAVGQVADHRLVDDRSVVGRTRRRLGRRILSVAAVAAVAMGALAGAGVLYVREKLDDVTTVDLNGAVTGDAIGIAKRPVTVLIVGSDERSGLIGARGDTILLLRADPTAGRAAVLSIPRDLWVPIAGQAGEQRINQALQYGPEVLVRTVTGFLDIPIDHYVQIDFDGFRRAVDAVGGIDVPFPTPARDPNTGLNVPTAGCVRLDGDAALALVRSRHFQYLENGRWRTDPTGDLGRIRRQQEFLLQVLRQVADVANPLTLNRLLDVAADHLAIDAELTTADLIDLAEMVRNVETDNVVFGTIETTSTRIGGAAVLTATPNAVAAVVDNLLAPPPTPPEELPPSIGTSPPTTTAPPQPGC